MAPILVGSVLPVVSAQLVNDVSVLVEALIEVLAFVLEAFFLKQPPRSSLFFLQAKLLGGCQLKVAMLMSKLIWPQP